MIVLKRTLCTDCVAPTEIRMLVGCLPQTMICVPIAGMPYNIMTVPTGAVLDGVAHAFSAYLTNSLMAS